MSSFPRVTLRLTKSGVCKAVLIDGHHIPAVLSADVRMRPEELTKFVLEIGVESIDTVFEEETDK
jgi:hypothetical protein